MFGFAYIEQRRLQILAEMEEHKNRLMSEMGDLDKETLAKLRDMVSIYYTARAELELQAEGLENQSANAIKKYREQLDALNRNFVDNLTLIKNEALYPEVTEHDEGKFMRVLNGKWQAVVLRNAEEVEV